jgi:hydroxyquinol 1,2-dioxygenase
MSSAASQALLERAIEAFGKTPDPRLREVLAALLSHLHAFIGEIRLTEAEWMKGIEFLTAVGQTCDDKRQEFILLSDVLGASMQVVAVQGDRAPCCTESTVFGPFHVEGAPRLPNGGDVANGARGTPCVVHGTVHDVQGSAIAHATVDVWQSDDDGLYDVQRPDLQASQGRGVLTTDANGAFWFRSVLPVPYPIPTDGPVGGLMRATQRSPWRPAHLHFRIQAPGCETLITHVFRHADPHLASDPVFGVRPTLVADWPRRADGAHELHFDFVLPRTSSSQPADA